MKNPRSSPFILVVGANFTPASDVALDEAVHIAAKIPGCELHVLRVVPRTTSSQRATAIARKLESYVEEIVAEADGSPANGSSRKTSIHIRSGLPVLEIARFATEVDADLIIVGRGRTGLHRWFGGDFVERLTRRTLVPVLAASERPQRRPEDAAFIEIEPPCGACVEERARTNGQSWWCAEHARGHVRGHAYRYRREHPFAHHDSNVIPTGV